MTPIEKLLMNLQLLGQVLIIRFCAFCDQKYVISAPCHDTFYYCHMFDDSIGLLLRLVI